MHNAQVLRAKANFRYTTWRFTQSIYSGLIALINKLNNLSILNKGTYCQRYDTAQWAPSFQVEVIIFDPIHHFALDRVSFSSQVKQKNDLFYCI